MHDPAGHFICNQPHQSVGTEKHPHLPNQDMKIFRTRWKNSIEKRISQERKSNNSGNKIEPGTSLYFFNKNVSLKFRLLCATVSLSVKRWLIIDRSTITKYSLLIKGVVQING